ncbi:MAG: glycosyltransferase family 1 protein [Clostridia bacterium]|nr:glycosyltransferase family 1 protein [Clostridia bacterium]
MEDNQEPIRIAQIIGKWVGGGVEAVIMNYYRAMNRGKIQFDFICDEDSTNIPYEEIKALGGKVILIPPYQKLFKYQRVLKKILREGNYKIVHSHINALSVFPLRIAKKVGVPIRIAHSHSTTNKKEWKKNFFKSILKPFSKVYATNYFCCTEHAGRWLFGNKKFENGDIYILNNAINLEKFIYNEKIRENKRAELKIDKDTIVLGHIGRFVEQKNHKFLINIFNEVHKKNINTKLILVGQGPLKKEIEQQIKQLNIEDYVLMLGQRADVNEIYQAFDIFLFPSLYEGLGMVAIEAQAAGNLCIVSTEIPKVAKVTKKMEFLDLSSPIQRWVDCILSAIDNIGEKSDISIDEFVNAGYDIKQESIKLEKQYLKLYDNSNR